MSLIKCSECGKEFSDKAKACPNCACPITEIKKDNKKKEKELEIDYSKEYRELTQFEKRLFNNIYASKSIKTKMIIILVFGGIFIFLGSYFTFSSLIKSINFYTITSIILLIIIYIVLIRLLYVIYKNNYEKSEMYLKVHKKDINNINTNNEKVLLITLIILSILTITCFIINSINYNEDLDYEARKRCWDKGMDYNEETGRCLTVDEYLRSR